MTLYSQGSENKQSGDSSAEVKTKRKHAGSSTYLFAQRYKTFFESINDGIAIFSHSGEILDANPMLTKLCGFPFQELVQKSIFDLFDTISCARINGYFEQLKHGSAVKTPIECVLINQNGKNRIIESNVSLLRGQYGHLESYMVVMHDVTVSKEHEQDLIRQADELERVFDAVPTILMVINHEMNIHRINNSGTATLSIEPEKCKGKSICEVINCINSHNPDRCLTTGECRGCLIYNSLVSCSIEGEIVLNKEVSIQYSPNPEEKRFYLLNAVPLENKGNHWCVLSLQDISVRKKNELESEKLHRTIAKANIELKRSLNHLAKSQSQLMTAQKLEQIGLLASGLAHNLRSPLGGIKGYSQLLQADFPETEELDMILEEVRIMESAINNLMIKSRRDHKKEEEVIDLNQLIKLELEFLEANMFFKHEISKEVTLDPDLPSILGVYFHFSQTFSNIMHNAMDAVFESENKMIAVKTYCVGGKIYIEVSDTGCGIPDEIIAKVFEPFFTTKPEENRSNNGGPVGTGLGLGSARQFMHKYGGKILIQSKENKGTRVTISLPDRSNQMSDKLRVLIIDDAPSMVDLISRICDDIGAESYGLNNSNEALAVYKKISPHIIISDLLMPGLTGPELMMQIRQINPDQKVVYITGYSENPEFIKFIDQECGQPELSVLVRKPFDIAEFKDVLQHMAGLA